VNVLGQHHVAHQLETVLLADLAEDFDEYSASSRRAQERQPSVPTKGDEVQVAVPVNALEASGHHRTAPRSQTERGHPQNIL